MNKKSEKSFFGNVLPAKELVIPNDYNPEVFIASYYEKYVKNRPDYQWGNLANEGYLENVTHQLVPGKKYKVTRVPILAYTVSSPQCIDFYKKNNFLFVGLPGLILAKKFLPKLFPIERWVISYDLKENLPYFKEQGWHGVPQMWSDEDRGARLTGAVFEHSRGYSHSLLCFSEA